MRSEGGEVEVGRLVLDLVLVLPLPLAHVLQVKDGPALRMVETRRAVEEPEEEERGGAHCDRLQA